MGKGDFDMEDLSKVDEKLSKLVGVRFTESQYKEIQQVAKEKNRKVADLIRILTLDAIERMNKI